MCATRACSHASAAVGHSHAAHLRPSLTPQPRFGARARALRCHGGRRSPKTQHTCVTHKLHTTPTLQIPLLAARKEGKRWLIGATPRFPAASALLEVLPVDESGSQSFVCIRPRAQGGGESMYLLIGTQLLADDLPEINCMSVAIPVDVADPASHHYAETAAAGTSAGSSTDGQGLPAVGEWHPGELNRRLADALHGQPTPDITVLQTKLPRCACP